MSRISVSLLVFVAAGAVLLAAEPAHARRHYLPGQGRWLQRDPAEYVDGMNLYEYTVSNPTSATDSWGLWRIERDGQPRARALSDSGDTVDALARELRLASEEYLLWLWAVDLSADCCAYPDTPYDALAEDCEFSIPNTVVVAWGSLYWNESWWLPNSVFSWLRVDMNRKVAFNYPKARGYYIREIDPARVTDLELSLRDTDLLALFYAGHGGGDSSLVPQVPSDVHGRVPERVYREGGLHRIAMLGLYTCYSADTARREDALRVGLRAVWRNNVTKRGQFVGVVGERAWWDYLGGPPWYYFSEGSRYWP